MLKALDYRVNTVTSQMLIDAAIERLEGGGVLERHGVAASALRRRADQLHFRALCVAQLVAGWPDDLAAAVLATALRDESAEAEADADAVVVVESLVRTPQKHERLLRALRYVSGVELDGDILDMLRELREGRGKVADGAQPAPHPGRDATSDDVVMGTPLAVDSEHSEHSDTRCVATKRKRESDPEF